MGEKTLNVLCIASYYKGTDFMKACKEAGANVFLLTSKKLENKDWPRESLSDIFYMEENDHGVWDMKYAIIGLGYVLREVQLDLIVSLDDFDVEKGALLREEFRIPGMGQTTARYFRDKLAMRMRAQEFGIPVPAFTPVFNNKALNEYLNSVPGPWMLKPRGEASATGIKKLYHADDVWKSIIEHGDDRYKYLIEQFKPGDVYHVDGLSNNGELIFCKSSRYLNTPMEVAHGGGIFRSVTLDDSSADAKALKKLNALVMKAFGMQYSASHSEFIKCHEDGKFYFLETSARVGGAHLSDMVTVATGINLWKEWAKLEIAKGLGVEYKLPKSKNDNAGIIISLARELTPDTSAFNDKEIEWRLNLDYHVGFIVKSDNKARIIELLDDYAHRIKQDLHASAPPKRGKSNNEN